MRRFALAIFYAMGLCAADDICGFWKTINESGQAQCIIAVYKYEDYRYGRIIGTFDSQGKMKDSIYKPVEKAPGVAGDRYYSGLDIIWYLYDRGSKFSGRILDPEHGKVYNADLWKDDDGNLVVRGKLGPFGRNQTWLPAQEADFPKGFKKPDLGAIVPDVPDTQ